MVGCVIAVNIAVSAIATAFAAIVVRLLILVLRTISAVDHDISTCQLPAWAGSCGWETEKECQE